MKAVNVHEAKTHLSRLLARVEEGEEVIIARAGRPVARITRFAPRGKQRPLNTSAGRIVYRRPLKASLPKYLRKPLGM